MPNALLAQFCRASELNPSFLRRCQREFKRDLQPLADRVQALEAENASLRAELEALRLAAQPKRRGRPPKVTAA